LRDYGILDTAPEAQFDDIAKIAAHICNAPIALVSFVDASRQWFKAEVGLGQCTTSREVSICAHAILQPEQGLFVVQTRQRTRASPPTRWSRANPSSASTPAHCWKRRKGFRSAPCASLIISHDLRA
jgi:GAF domain-containing protein